MALDTITNRTARAIIEAYDQGSVEAARDYRRILDGLVRFASEAQYRRVAVLQALRTIADHGLAPGRPHGLTFFDHCPDCSSAVFDTKPVTVGELRECGNTSCGTVWRHLPRHRDAETYQRMAARTAKAQRFKRGRVGAAA
jgi:hypothetical protein